MLDQDHVTMKASSSDKEFVKAVKDPILEMTVGNIGDESCTGGAACISNSGDIKDGSCQGRRSCESNSGNIEKGSCKGVLACNLSTGKIGENSCNGKSACCGNTNDIAPNTCNESQRKEKVSMGKQAGELLEELLYLEERSRMYERFVFHTTQTKLKRCTVQNDSCAVVASVEAQGSDKRHYFLELNASTTIPLSRHCYNHHLFYYSFILSSSIKL
eukprot:scaffold15554_cov155-Skeletonema_dohrnii-CCMP3373.AAC.3